MSIDIKRKILYIGGFQLPDRNAAAQRVIGIAKSLRDVGYQVRFINALKQNDCVTGNKEYFGFSTYEYKRENDIDYLFLGETVCSIIKSEKPNIVIAYNYPAFSLNRVRKYCQVNNIKCIADVTEWYKAYGGGILYKLVKTIDSSFRMRYVHKRMDALITISRYLYDYYSPYVPVVLVPPTVDVDEEKWKVAVTKDDSMTSFVYAGSPSAIKERLDLVVEAVELCAKEKNIVLNVVGITKKQFVEMYSWKKSISNAVVFWGRIPHMDAVSIVKKSAWSIIIRDNNSVVKAGFPTKLVESISCGTPVISNRFSNVVDYLNDNNSIVIDDVAYIVKAIKMAIDKKTNVDKQEFDYHKYVQDMQMIMK